MNIQSGIYIIQNLVDHKVYVGSALNLRRRYINHFALLRKGSHPNDHLQNAWNKRGEENFIFWIVESVQSKDQLLVREQFYLDMFQNYAFGMYNFYLAANSPLGSVRSDEAKRKISVSLNKFWSSHNSKEARQKIIESCKDRKHSEETKEKIRKAREKYFQELKRNNESSRANHG